MPRQVVSNHVVVFGDLFVFEQAAPLMVVAPRGVLANQRLSLAVVQIENFVFFTVNIDGDVSAGNR